MPNKVGTALDPIRYAEDDIFDGTKAKKDDEDKDEDYGKIITRTSPLIMSPAVTLRKAFNMGRDEGYVHLVEGTPVPYITQFSNTPYECIFSLDYSRLCKFNIAGDRVELDEDREYFSILTGLMMSSDHIASALPSNHIINNIPTFLKYNISKSIRVTIPNEIADAVELKLGDFLDWDWYTDKGKKYIRAKKVE